jgi:hypothetical protein
MYSSGDKAKSGSTKAIQVHRVAVVHREFTRKLSVDILASIPRLFTHLTHLESDEILVDRKQLAIMIPRQAVEEPKPPNVHVEEPKTASAWHPERELFESTSTRSGILQLE